MREYRVIGEDKQQGALGKAQRFVIKVLAFSTEQAVKVARNTRYDLGRDHVHIKSAKAI